jgi:glycosyltransferase involved in cell wall biosynthesis
MEERKWICCQIGAREHYAVARALHQGGRLASLYTDFWAGPAVRKLVGGGWGYGGKQKVESRNAGSFFGTLRSLVSRFHPELKGAAVTSWNVRALLWETRLRQKSEVRDHGFIEVGSRFAVRVREALKRRSDLGPDSIFFAYDTGALETMEWCRERGIKRVLNQMDPNRVEVELVRAEEECWPGWASYSTQVPEEYFCRREQEWALADRVIVNSEFCRQALVKQGVSSEKLVVIPLCYETEDERLEVRSQKSEPSSINHQPSTGTLRVLFLGQVILRKGIQYLIEAARKLKGENIRFEVVGPIGISRGAIASAPRNMTFHGRATRDQAANWYRQADVFVLPTLSDGFALTQIEAMAHGLPVVTTPCCGEVVSDGVDGFIVLPRNAEVLAKTFLRYLEEPNLLKAQQNAALTKAAQFTLNRLANNLLRLESLLLNK